MANTRKAAKKTATAPRASGRRLRYQVAVSLDGFIATPDGGYDWIVMDPTIDFGALFGQFDAAVMGRKTYEVGLSQGTDGTMKGMDVYVFSRTLPASKKPGIEITRDDPRQVVTALKAQKGKDIWLFGGGSLFRSLLSVGLVDTVELAVIPVLLGEGIPLLPSGATTTLELSDAKTLPSGIVALAYAVPGGIGPAPTIDYIRTPKAKAPTRRAGRKAK
jgi:dihydrofolate reductase